MAAKADGMAIIKQHIASGEFSRVYLLFGEESYLVNQFKNELAGALGDKEDSMNFMIYKGEKAVAENIKDFAMTMPFFADRRVVLVEDSGFFKKANEAVEAFIEEIPESTVLVFVEHEVDRRLKLYKQLAKVGTVAEFTTPDASMLQAWIMSMLKKAELEIERGAVDELLASVGFDMNTLANEVEKLKYYCLEKKRVSVADVREICVSQVESKVFEMMDMLSAGNKQKTMELYNDLLLLKEPPMRILALITRQFNLLMKTKFVLDTTGNSSQVASAIKVPPFAVKKYVSQCNGYTAKQLATCVNMCQQADGDIKSGAKKDDMAVEMLIINLLNR